MDMNADMSNASVPVSIISAHVQKAGSCDLILNKRALGNGRAWQQGCRESDSVIRQKLSCALEGCCHL